MFAGRDEDAAARGRIAASIRTAQLKGRESHARTGGTPEAVTAGHSNDHTGDPLPWNFDGSLSCYPDAMLEPLTQFAFMR